MRLLFVVIIFFITFVAVFAQAGGGGGGGGGGSGDGETSCEEECELKKDNSNACIEDCKSQRMKSICLVIGLILAIVGISNYCEKENKRHKFESMVKTHNYPVYEGAKEEEYDSKVQCLVAQIKLSNKRKVFTFHQKGKEYEVKAMIKVKDSGILCREISIKGSDAFGNF